MVYSKERGQMIDRIFKAFQHYIQEQNYFDIVYSEKIGYVWLLVDQPSDAVADVLDSPEAMLDSLFNDIITDVVISPSNPYHIPNSLILSEYEETESRRRITAILETMGDDKDFCLDYLEKYLKEYQKNALDLT